MPRYEQTNETFVNPYNFIPLDGTCDRKYNYGKIKKEKTNLTGWLECNIETLTPVFIPNTTNNDVFKAGNNIKSYDFFSYENLEGKTDIKPSLPVIPGSEIRGMIRNAFEALTNSCMSTIDDEQLLYKRTTQVGNPGRLYYKDSKWEIKKCERIGISKRSTRGDQRDFSDFLKKLEEGKKVYIKINGPYYKKIKGRDVPIFKIIADISLTPKNGYSEGFYHKGEAFGNRKHHESIFIESKEQSFKIESKDVENYIKNLKLYRDDKINIHKRKNEHNGYEHLIDNINELKNLKNSNNAVLIYYKEHNGHFYLSPSAIGREIFHNKLSTIIGDYKSCKKSNLLCPACVLFGIAGKEDAACSRVRFTDAFIVNNKKTEEYYETPVILPELASPKLSATEFYLKKPEKGADLWNYDYAIKNKQEIDYSPSIRGRKFYWHKKITSTPVEKNKPSERNVKIRSLKAGNTFIFKVYFNDISEEELKKLLWVINIGNKKENAHKTGMGKPVGMGSVKISVNEVKVRNIALNEKTIEHNIVSDKKYLKQPESEQEIIKLLSCTIKVLRDFLRITDYKNAPNNISYPKNTDSEESYNWFVANKGGGVSHIISQILPEIQSPELKKYKEKEDDRNRNYNRRRY